MQNEIYQFMSNLHPLRSRVTLVFVVLAGFFITNALVAEFIGVKLFSVEGVLGIEPFRWTIFGVNDLGLTMTAGVLLWPIVFIMTDIINEYFGIKGVRILSYLTVVLILYSFFIVYFAIWVKPDSWWAFESGFIGEIGDVDNMQIAYRRIFGQGMWIIGASVIAFLVGQLVDVLVFRRIKIWTGESKLWLRANGSTFVSQFIDSYLILMIAFWIGAGWEWQRVLAIGTINFMYKVLMAFLLTPLIYLIHFWIDKYLGEEQSEELRKQALENT